MLSLWWSLGYLNDVLPVVFRAVFLFCQVAPLWIGWSAWKVIEFSAGIFDAAFKFVFHISLEVTGAVCRFLLASMAHVVLSNIPPGLSILAGAALHFDESRHVSTDWASTLFGIWFFGIWVIVWTVAAFAGQLLLRDQRAHLATPTTRGAGLAMAGGHRHRHGTARHPGLADGASELFRHRTRLSSVRRIPAGGAGHVTSVGGEQYFHTGHCVICIQGFTPADNQVIRSLPCEHTFHQDCISRWLDNNTLCPTCRRPVTR